MPKLLALLFCFAISLPAQLAAHPGEAPAETLVRANPLSNTAIEPPVAVLLLSDVHLDPFRDPGKVAALAAIPVSGWPALLAAPPTPNQAIAFQDLQAACNLRGADTSPELWLSTLHQISLNAAASHFVAVSGDLLAHSFDCKFQHTLPNAPPGAFASFVNKTIQYVARSLQAALPATPIYLALGNNDSTCGDYRDNLRSEFLAVSARTLAESLPASERRRNLADATLGGFYNAPLPAPFTNARIIVLDDLFLSARYTACDGTPAPAAQAAPLDWLETQLADARRRGQHVWLLGHIPPGVDLYSTLRQFKNICTEAKPRMFLGDERLARIMTENADIIRLAVFGHSHTDELRLLTPEPSATKDAPIPGAPARDPAQHPQPGTVSVKIIPSISPINGNRPAYTLARVDAASSTLVDYTVFGATDPIGTAWQSEYTWSTTYHQPAFDPASLATLTGIFHDDPAAASPESRAYLRNLYIGDRSPLIKPFWPEYVCALTHNTAAGFTQCVCAR